MGAQFVDIGENPRLIAAMAHARALKSKKASSRGFGFARAKSG
jgi:hypothetical protein